MPLCGAGTIDTVVAMTTLPLFDFTGWDAAVAAERRPDRHRRACPDSARVTTAIGQVDAAGGALLGPGTIDAYGEQLMAGADHDGDVLVILGSTLIMWAVVPEWIRGRRAVDRAPHGARQDPGRRPVERRWAVPELGRSARSRHVDETTASTRPMCRSGSRTCGASGCRSTTRICRASLHDLHIGMGPTDDPARPRTRRRRSPCGTCSISPAASASASSPPAAACTARRWVQALADGTGLPVDVVEVPEGAALGAAYLGARDRRAWRPTPRTLGVGPAPPDGWTRTHRFRPRSPPATSATGTSSDDRSVGSGTGRR